MRELGKRVLVKYIGSDDSKIVHKNTVFAKKSRIYAPLVDVDELNDEQLFIVNGETVTGPIEIVDHDDDLQLLRNRNTDVSGKRIPVIKRKSLSAATNVVINKKRRSVNKENKNKQGCDLRKDETAQRKRLENAERSVEDENNEFFKNLDEMESESNDNFDDPEGASGDIPHHSSSSPPPTTHDSPRNDRWENESEPSTIASSHVAQSTNRDGDRNNNMLQDIGNLSERISSCNKEIKRVKRSMVTKSILDDSLSNALSKSSNEKNLPGKKDPKFDAEGQVQILEDCIMTFDDYNAAVNATTNCRRAKRVMRGFWPTEERLKMLTQYDPKRPDYSIVPDKDYAKLIKIVMALQEYKKIPVFSEKDRVMNNIKQWVGQWLKNEKYRHKIQHNT